MARTLRVHASVDLGHLAEDLRSIELQLGPETGKALAAAADTVVKAMPAYTPYDPEHRDTRKDHLPHLRDTFSARRSGDASAVILTSHPGGPVHEYGGSIAPRGVAIRIRESGMANKAAQANAEAVEQDIAARIDVLLRRHGL